MRNTIAFLGIILGMLSLTHCGDTEGEKACKRLNAKLKKCKLEYVAGEKCGAKTDVRICVVNCMIKAPCDELENENTDSDLIRCEAECSGAGPDDFICADGMEFLSPEFVCDEEPDCTDGSDEANCDKADAGAVDAGED
jgi:hypothetical protein